MRERRRLVREQMLVVLVLLMALAATVAVLANQWLGSPSSAGAGLESHIRMASSFLGGIT